MSGAKAREVLTLLSGSTYLDKVSERRGAEA